MSEFRGIAGVRGVIVPVFDLASLLGYPGVGSARWLVTARDATVGFLVDDFEGQVRVDADALVAHESGSRAHVREVVRTSAISRPVVHLPSLVEAIGKRTADTDPRREG
jgi:purine-binding chemotaxis protein CheW